MPDASRLRLCHVALVVICVAALSGTRTYARDMAPDMMALEHMALLELIAEDFSATASWTGISDMSTQVHDAMLSVPRHQFVPGRRAGAAYANHPLSIGHGQTISQPFIVALMTELCALSPGQRVLEIGTGSGYQAAVLAALDAEVFTIEIIPELARRARRTLDELNIQNVQIRTGDGNLGWPEEAPFDAIIVTAGGALAPALFDQLAEDGRIVIPLGDPRGEQVLAVVTRGDNGEQQIKKLLPVRFVPLVGE